MEKKKNLSAKWSLNMPVSWNLDISEDFSIIANIIGMTPFYRETQFYYEQYFKDVEWNERLKDLIKNFKINIGAQKGKNKKTGVLISKEKVLNDQELVGLNRNKAIISIAHRELTRIGDSDFRSICPECRRGIIAVKRNPETFELEKYDNCLLCGQRFKYLDIP